MHIRLEILAYRVSARAWATLDLLTYVTALLIYILVVWQGIGWSWDSFVTKDILQGRFPIPYWPSKFAFLLGSIILCIQYLIDIVMSSLRIKDPEITLKKAEPIEVME
jgi:TRAP-type C4-dicarboxylate transport system permease small subunit